MFVNLRYLIFQVNIYFVNCDIIYVNEPGFLDKIRTFIFVDQHLYRTVFILTWSFTFSDVVKVGAEELKPALSYCTHLVYGYVGIDDDKFKAISLDPKLDLPESKDVKGGKGNFKSITALKKAYPSLTILLSVGGNADTEDPDKYLSVVSTNTSFLD